MAKKKITPKKKTISPLAAQVRNLHKTGVGLLLVLAVAVGVMMGSRFYPVSLNYVTKDALLSDTQTVFVPAERVIFDIDLRWLVWALLGFSIIYSMLLLTRWKASYQKALAGRIYLWRWVYFALVGDVMVKLAAMNSGVENLLALKMAGGLIILAMAFAWLSERQNENAAKPVKSALLLFWLSGLLAFIMVGSSLVGTAVYGMVSLPWHVYVLDGLVVFNFFLIGNNLRLSNLGRGKHKDYMFVERNYVLVTLFMQVVFAALAVFAFHK